MDRLPHRESCELTERCNWAGGPSISTSPVAVRNTRCVWHQVLVGDAVHTARTVSGYNPPPLIRQRVNLIHGGLGFAARTGNATTAAAAQLLVMHRHGMLRRRRRGDPSLQRQP